MAGDAMKIHYTQSFNVKTIVQPLWWDNSCEEAKSKKYSLLRKFRSTNSSNDYTAYITHRNRFKSTCKLKKKHFQRKRRSDLMYANMQHANLWYSLERKGISQNSKFLKIFKSMYSQLKSCVKIKNG